MNSVKSSMPLWKWILLIVFGSALFLFLSQTVPVVGSFSNNIWLKALLLLLGTTAVLGLYAVWVKVFERRKVSELNLRRALPDMLTGLLIGSLFIASVVGVLNYTYQPIHHERCHGRAECKHCQANGGKCADLLI